MKFVHEEILVNKGIFSETTDYSQIHHEILEGIRRVVWPNNSSKFTIYPQKKENGVSPIKNIFMDYLESKEWKLEHKLDISTTIRKPGKIDATKQIGSKYYAIEWETGNISSSHRAINKIFAGILTKKLIGGTLIVPTRSLYSYLTDRVGNFQELEPYFQVWKSICLEQGYVSIIAVEHDDIDENVPPIRKGTDGRALV